ncbi:unnamed protein product [Thelazia callipaeda]|uniref:Uncharacterized protein n=1 Tax=Thelazia callipaeda TaxID=103827 RepID=A0A0N5D2G8_THECL|nr:unnamed protein product [Thelazia callipaeda]
MLKDKKQELEHEIFEESKEKKRLMRKLIEEDEQHVHYEKGSADRHDDGEKTDYGADVRSGFQSIAPDYEDRNNQKRVQESDTKDLQSELPERIKQIRQRRIAGECNSKKTDYDYMWTTTDDGKRDESKVGNIMEGGERSEVSEFGRKVRSESTTENPNCVEIENTEINPLALKNKLKSKI